VSEYRITGGWLADLGSLKEKGQGDHKQLLKSHWNSRLKAPVSLKGTVGQRGLGHAGGQLPTAPLTLTDNC